MKNYSPPCLAFYHTDTFEIKEAKIRQALVEHPEDHLALHYQLSLLLLTKDTERSAEAIAAGQYIVDHACDEEDTSTGYELMAICYEHMKQDKESAIKYYTASLEATGNNESSLSRLACIYMDNQQFEKALHYYQLLEQVDPGSSLVEIGELHIELKNMELAQASLEAALPDNETMEVYNGLGLCAAAKGEAEKAMAYFKLSLQKDPDHYAANFHIAFQYQEAKDYYRALHHYTKVVSAQPDFGEAYNNMAACYDGLGDDPEACLNYLHKALEANPPDQLKTLLYLNLARLHGRRKNFDLQEHYQQKLLNSLGLSSGSEEE